MKNESTSKRTTILTIVNVTATILALLSALYSNLLVNQQNSLIERGQRSEVAVNTVPVERTKYIAPFFVEQPCQPLTTQSAYWKVDFIETYDINNRGGMPVELINISQPKPDTVAEGTRKYPLSMSAEYNAFLSLDDFLGWYQNNSVNIQSSGGIVQNISELKSTFGGYTFAGLPIKIEPGETVRLVVRGTQSFSIKIEDYPPDRTEFTYGGNWGSGIDFIFNDGSLVSLIRYTVTVR